MREYGFNDIANYVLNPIEVEVLRFNRYYILLNERDVNADVNADLDVDADADVDVDADDDLDN